jgi:hypothetical protein
VAFCFLGDRGDDSVSGRTVAVINAIVGFLQEGKAEAVFSAREN